MSYIDNRIKFWENVLKYSKKKVCIKKANKRLEILLEAKKMRDDFVNGFRGLQEPTVELIDDAFKSVLEK